MDNVTYDTKSPDMERESVLSATPLADFNYRKLLKMQGSSGAGTTYPVRVVAHYAKGDDGSPNPQDIYLNGHCQEDFDDVVFTDDDGVTKLSFWRDDCNVGNRADFWIKVNDDLDVDQSIYIYYGNGQAVTESSGYDTFIFFDDFENNDLSRWTVAENNWATTSNYKRYGSYAAFGNSDSSGRGLHKHVSINYNVMIHSWVKVRYPNDGAVEYAMIQYDNTECANPAYGACAVLGKVENYAPIPSWEPYPGGRNTLTSGWQRWELAVDFISKEYQFSLGTPLERQLQGSLPLLKGDGTELIEIESISSITHWTPEYDHFLDDFYVRKWISQEPQLCMWGYEEGIDANVFLDEGSFYKALALEGSGDVGTFHNIRIEAHKGIGSDDSEKVYLEDCEDDFSDVFFMSEDHKVWIDYWMEESTLGSSATYWIEVPDDLSAGEQCTVYICYGGGVAKHSSNGPETFIFFDDFENDNLDTWTVAENNWDTTSSQKKHGSYAAFGNSDSSGRGLHKHVPINHDVMIHSWVKVNNPSDGATEYAMLQYDNIVCSNPAYGACALNDGVGIYSGSWNYYDGVSLDTSWHRWELAVDFTNDVFDFTFDGNTDHSSTKPLRRGDGSALTKIETISSVTHMTSGNDHYLDDFYVRKWTSDEPDGEWGEEAQIIYHEDCSSLNTWNHPSHRETRCHDWAFPIMKDIEGAGTLACPAPDRVYFDIYNLDISQISPMWHWEIGTPFKLSKLHEFRLDVECCPTSISEKGELHIALFSDNDILTSPFDDTPHAKPIVDIVFSDDTTSDHSISVRGLYYDEMLIEYTSDTLVDVNEYLKAEFIVELDAEGNLILSAEGIGAVVIAPWTVVNTERIVEHVGFQVKSDTDPRPSLRIHDILVSQYSTGHEDLELAYGNEPLPMAQMFRSAPKYSFLELRGPGPATEIQVFPENGKLYFSFTHVGLSLLGFVCLDIRLISGSSPQDIELFQFHSQWGSWVSRGSQSLTYDFVDPGPPTVNFIREWMSLPFCTGENKIMIDVGLQTDCIIALRGIWIFNAHGHRYDVVQLFDPSNDYELEYLIPMGPDTKIDFEWGGDSNAYVDPFIDGHPIIGSYGYPRRFNPDFEYNDVVLDVQLPDYTTSNDFVRNNLHRLKLKYTGSSSSAFVKTMHVNYLWVNIEYDWIKYNGVEYDPIDLVNFPYLTDYYRDHTHGRIEVHRGSYIDSPSAVLDAVDLCELGNNGHYGHVGDRYWIWTVYQTDSPSFGGVKISTAALAYDGQDYYNGWKQWTAMWVKYRWQIIPPGWISWMTAATLHEWGHIAHNHEGYINDPSKGENCEHNFCVYHDGDIFPNSLICAFHGHQTWYNVNDYYARWPWHWEHDWYML